MARQIDKRGRAATSRYLRGAASTAFLRVGLGIADPAVAQKQGGVLKASFPRAQATANLPTCSYHADAIDGTERGMLS
jgi:hypothetical protein